MVSCGISIAPTVEANSWHSHQGVFGGRSQGPQCHQQRPVGSGGLRYGRDCSNHLQQVSPARALRMSR